MAIAPNTDIILLKGVPLDNGYKHTLYFANTTTQYNHFNTASYGQKRFINNTYQRVNKNTLKLQVVADEIYDYNYMMFRNTNYGNKWFYAFITECNYLNDKTSEIVYEIDDIQTYFIGSSLPYCFVEREHSVTDIAGDNILPEPVELGEYCFADFDKISADFDDQVIIAMITDDGSIPNAHSYGHTYSGCTLYYAYADDYSALTLLKVELDNYIQQPDQVVCLYTCPKALFTPEYSNGVPLTFGIIPDQNPVVFDIPITNIITTGSNRDSFQGYLPKNKKLYTYPYNYIKIDNNNGESLALRYEFFNNYAQTPSVRCYGSFLPPVSVVLKPRNYKGIMASGISYRIDTSESISLNGYPLCSWNVDTFRAWVAQNLIPMATKTATSIGSALVTQNPLILGVAVNELGNTISKTYSASIMADQSKGSINSGNPNYMNGVQSFYTMRAHISKNYAQMIDNFFSTYGYACNQIKVPNISARPHWNYIKTHDIKLNTYGPSEAINHIETIFNSGITFWKNASEVGNYNYDNSPV